MDKSKLLESWGQFADSCPDDAAEVRKTICSLYAARAEQATFMNKLRELQGQLSARAQGLLDIDVANKQLLAAWAQAMGMIFLVKKERSL